MRTYATLIGGFLASMAASAQSPELALQADRSLEAGSCETAIPLYRKAIEAHPGDYVSTSRLAACLLQLGKNEEAIVWEKKAAEFSSERPNRLFDLAILYTRIGDRDQALEYLEKALDATGARFRTAAENLKRNEGLKPLHGDPRFEALVAKAYGPGYEPPSEQGFAPEKVKRGVELILSTLEQNSPNPYRYFTKAQWRARADEIIARAGTLDENAYFWELVSLLGMNGDVHTNILPLRDSSFIERSLPLRLWRFSDGLYIRAAAPELQSLVGAEILRIGSFDVESGWEDLVRRFPTENPGMSSAHLALYLILPDFARAMGWTTLSDGVPLTLRMKDGTTATYQVPASVTPNAFHAFETTAWLNPEKGFVDASDAARTPLWQTNREQNYWYKYLPDHRAVYFAFNNPQDDPNKEFEQFLKDLVREVERRKAQRLVIDLRNNPGGLGIMAVPLVHALARSPVLNMPGRIAVLTSRATQSAGTIIAAQLERNTDAVFLGEPTGDAPNLFNAPFGNHVSWSVPGVRAFFRYSSVAEQQSDPLDTRNAIYPDVPIWMSFSDYSTGKDPVLDRALTMNDSEARAFLSDPGGRFLPRYARWRRDSQIPTFPSQKLPRRYY